MSILDPVQKTLAKDVWLDGTNKLRPEIRAQLLEGVHEFLSDDNIIGTIAGYQYKPTSDIDVNVSVNPPELVTDLITKQNRKATGGRLAAGTQHPINYFLVTWKGLPQDWGDSAYGVYDVLADAWVKDPGLAEDVKDPQSVFGLELKTAHLFYNKFEHLVNKWEADMDRLEALQEAEQTWLAIYNKKIVENLLKDDFNALLEFCHDMDRERKFEYSTHWGIPRVKWRNIVFKSLEGSKLERYFEFFKDLKALDYYTIFSNIVKEIPEDKIPLVGYRANKLTNPTKSHPLLGEIRDYEDKSN